jgi:hypothetical protein
VTRYRYFLSLLIAVGVLAFVVSLSMHNWFNTTPLSKQIESDLLATLAEGNDVPFKLQINRTEVGDGWGTGVEIKVYFEIIPQKDGDLKFGPLGSTELRIGKKLIGGVAAVSYQWNGKSWERLSTEIETAPTQ